METRAKAGSVGVPDLALSLEEIGPGKFVVCVGHGAQLSKPLWLPRLRALTRDAEFVADLNARPKKPNESHIDVLLGLRPQLESPNARWHPRRLA